MEKRHGRHKDIHVGMPKQLREAGEDSTAEYFETLDTFRAGRWYGDKGNGNVVNKCVKIINDIKEWALKNDI